MALTELQKKAMRMAANCEGLPEECDLRTAEKVYAGLGLGVATILSLITHNTSIAKACINLMFSLGEDTK